MKIKAIVCVNAQWPKQSTAAARGDGSSRTVARTMKSANAKEIE